MTLFLWILGGLGFGWWTSAGSACASPSVDWPAMPDATSSGSAGVPGAPVPGLACPVLLSAYATASATRNAAAAANNARRLSSEGIGGGGTSFAEDQSPVPR